MKASKALQQGAALVSDGREKQHGPKVRNFNNIAILWNAYILIRRDPASALTPSDVAAMMALLKLARSQSGNHNDDDYVDGAAYLGIMGEFNGKG